MFSCLLHNTCVHKFYVRPLSHPRPRSGPVTAPRHSPTEEAVALEVTSVLPLLPNKPRSSSTPPNQNQFADCRTWENSHYATCNQINMIDLVSFLEVKWGKKGVWITYKKKGDVGQECELLIRKMELTGVE